jgi:small conductance mechanosensitive channel
MRIRLDHVAAPAHSRIVRANNAGTRSRNEPCIELTQLGSSDASMQRNLYSRLRLVALVAACLLASTPAGAAPPEQAKPPGKTITLHAGPETDRAIEQRLAAIYAELEPLRGIEVTADSGVVHLGGQVHSLEAVAEAKAIAERVEGVAAVSVDIQQEARVSRRLLPVFEQMRDRVSGWLSYLPLIVVALGAIALAWFLARWLGRHSRHRDQPDTFARLITGQLLRGGILAMGIAIALEVLGARGLLGAMIGTAGVLGIVIGFAFKNIGEAYLASILLSMRRPFDPHDYVRIDEVEGSVVRLTSRATVLMTANGNLVSIPNSKVFGATIINFTRNPQRRIELKLRVALDADLRHVQELAIATLACVPGVLPEPAPICLVDEFSDFAMVISVAGWINQRESDWLKVSSEVKLRIKAAFQQAGIDIPEPIFRVRTTTFEPRQRTPQLQAEPTLDVSPDDHIDRQVDEERASSVEDDLLRRSGERGD